MNIRFLIIFTLFFPFFSIANDPLVSSREFIEDLGKKVISEISDPKIERSTRKLNFRKIYFEAFDNKYITKFVLGRHWKAIDSNTKNEFLNSFNEYIIQVYAPKFKGWDGEFKTISSTNIKKNLYLVEMLLINKKNNTSNLKLDWRIYLNKKNKFQIIDVNINGVSMLITQRAEFASVIKNSPDGVKGLIKKLKSKIKS